MKNRTIKKKIFFYICTLTILSLAIISFTVYILFFQTLERNEIAHTIQTSDKTKQNIEFVLKLVDNTGSLLGTNKELLEELKKEGTLAVSNGNGENENQNKISIMLQNIISVQEYIRGIYIVGTNGNFYTSDSGINEAELKKRYSFPLNEVTSPGKYYMGSHQIDYHSLSNSYVISYIRPLYDIPSEKKLGTIIVDINYDYLKELFTKSSIQNDEKVLVVSRKGETIFTHPFNVILDDIIEKDPQLLELDKAELRRDVFGEDSIIVSNTIEYSEWKIIKVISTRRIYKDTSAVRTVAIIVSIIFIILSLSVSIILSLTLTKPILELNKKIKLVEKGDLSVNIPVRTNDELGELSRSFNNMVIKLKELINKVVEEQRRKSDMEFEILQAQINPHFLYNTLDSIKWLAVIQNVNNISEMTTSLINLLKYNISKNNPTVSLEEEIESVANYAKIQKFRYGNMFDIEYRISEEARKCKVLKLILQPIVENAIFHGFENFEDNGIIRIDAEVDSDSKLVIHVFDNGAGMDTENLNSIFAIENSKKKFSGIGIKNIQERIKLYFGAAYGISFYSKLGKGTEVTITLPAIC